MASHERSAGLGRTASSHSVIDHREGPIGGIPIALVAPFAKRSWIARNDRTLTVSGRFAIDGVGDSQTTMKGNWGHRERVPIAPAITLLIIGHRF